MFRNNLQEKSAKTALLLGVISLVSYATSSCFSNRSIGLLITLAVDALAIYKLHEFGKSRRLGSNLLNQATNFVAARAPGEANLHSTVLQNGCRNVINGGAAVTDEITNSLEQFANQASRRGLRR